MAINKSRIKRLRRLLDTAITESTAVCQSRGLKGIQESRVFTMHERILKASAALNEVQESIDRKTLLKAKTRAFNPDELNPKDL